MNKSRMVWGFVLLSAVSLTQSVFAGWWRAYGGGDLDLGYSVQETFDGGYIISGHSQSFGGLWILKTDANGDTLWSRVYEGDIKWDKTCVQQTYDGGYIATGSGWGLLKIDQSGNIKWTKDLEWELCWLEQTSDSGYILGATEKEYSEEGYFEGSYIRLLKTDIRGETIWTRRYEVEEVSWPYKNPYVSCVQQTRDKGYIVAGSVDHKTCWKPFLLKTNPIGVKQWLKVYEYRTKGYWVGQTEDYGYILSCGGLLLKTNYKGEIRWEHFYPGSGACAQQTTDEGYILAGWIDPGRYQSYNLWLAKTDRWGDTLWTRIYGGTGWDWGECVQQTSDGGYIVVGTTVSFSVGWGDIYLLKTDSLGYVAVEEQPVTDVTPSWKATPIGHQIVLKYEDRPLGFHASVFSASGRKVDELHSTLTSGTILWGQGFSPGVYFIREVKNSLGVTRKVVLVK